jgi:hypothetical protein
MGFTWRSNGDGTAEAVETEAFAEVIYEDATILVVNVATNIVLEDDLANALMDAIATSEQRHEAESAIAALARSFGMDVHPVDGVDQRALTIAPAAGAAVEPSGGATN